MPTRDSIIWVLGFFGAVLMYVTTDTGLIPETYVHKVKDIAAVCGFICGLLSVRKFNGEPQAPK
jgi:hypothetical protein